MRTTHTVSTAVLTLTILMAVVVGAVIGGSLVAYNVRYFGPVRVYGEDTGTITLVNAQGSAICLNEQSGTQVCADVLVSTDDPSLAVGQTITATRAWVTRNGTTLDTLILTAVTPAAP